MDRRIRLYAGLIALRGGDQKRNGCILASLPEKIVYRELACIGRLLRTDITGRKRVETVTADRNISGIGSRPNEILASQQMPATGPQQKRLLIPVTTPVDWKRLARITTNSSDSTGN
jgi:hypothetical protein